MKKQLYYLVDKHGNTFKDTGGIPFPMTLEDTNSWINGNYKQFTAIETETTLEQYVQLVINEGWPRVANGVYSKNLNELLHLDTLESELIKTRNKIKELELEVKHWQNAYNETIKK